MIIKFLLIFNLFFEFEFESTVYRKITFIKKLY